MVHCLLGGNTIELPGEQLIKVIIWEYMKPKYLNYRIILILTRIARLMALPTEFSNQAYNATISR